jgi:hypothetical protein
MSRLTYLNESRETTELTQFEGDSWEELIKNADTVDQIFMHNAIDKLYEYEDLEEQGLLLKLPCKFGSNVYTIATIYECKHDYLDCPMDFPDVYQCERNCKCEYEYKKLVVRPIIFKFEMLKDFNKKVFLTKEEAEQELKRMEGAE